MKNIILFSFLFCSLLFNAQVIIGDAVGTATEKKSVLLEFANNNNKGLILPYVKKLPTTVTQGTILLDATDATKARVKFYNANSTAGSNGWTDLSGQDANISSVMISQPSTVENVDAKAIIGATTSTADGVLVLESSDKAMILPIVSDVNNIPTPSPGMMVYVNKDNAQRLAVYNGSVWTFWRP